MPYIVSHRRDVLNPAIETILNALRELECDDPGNDMGGNLNYAFTKILHQCYGERYAEMAQAVSVLEMCKLEYYRKIASPYEIQKCFENGDVE